MIGHALVLDTGRLRPEAIVDRLREKAHRVSLVAGAGDAMDQLSTDPTVDCLLLTSDWPGIDAETMCRTVKLSTALHSLPIVMLAEGEGTAAALSGLGAGADDVIALATDVDLVLALIGARVRRKRACEEAQLARENLLRAQLLTAQESATAQGSELSVAWTRAHSLESANADLLRLDQLKSDFITSVSHELRTPLAAITGFAEILLDDEFSPTDPRRAHLQAIDRNAARLLHLVEDILALANGGAPQRAARWAPVDLVAVVGSAVERIRPTADSRNVRLETDLPLSLPLQGEPDGLARVVVNLLSNAVKYSPQGRTVRVLVTHDAQQAVIIVQDEGIGISAKELPHVFTRFFRSADHESHAVPGAGLGLAVVHETVERHGGTVTAESALGQGTTMTVRLPFPDDA